MNINFFVSLATEICSVSVCVDEEKCSSGDIIGCDGKKIMFVIFYIGGEKWKLLPSQGIPWIRNSQLSASRLKNISNIMK